MAAFTREELDSFRDRSVDDLIGPAPRLLIVGINPGLWTAATNTHFCHPTNRYYPALGLAGLIDWELDTASGLSDHQRSDLVRRGIAITNLVARATARADELDPSELTAGAERLKGLVERITPALVAVAGVTAYRVAFARPGAALGKQGETIAGSPLWVIPNPSGLNAHVSTADMAAWLRQLAGEAALL